VGVNDEMLTKTCKGDAIVQRKTFAWDCGQAFLSAYLAGFRCISSERVEASFWWHFLLSVSLLPDKEIDI